MLLHLFPRRKSAIELQAERWKIATAKLINMAAEAESRVKIFGRLNDPFDWENHFLGMTLSNLLKGRAACRLSVVVAERDISDSFHAARQARALKNIKQMGERVRVRVMTGEKFDLRFRTIALPMILKVTDVQSGILGFVITDRSWILLTEAAEKSRGIAAYRGNEEVGLKLEGIFDLLMTDSYSDFYS